MIELLIVIVIIAIFATISIVAYSGIQERAHLAAIKADLTSSARQIEFFKLDGNGDAPGTESEYRQADLKQTDGVYAYLFYCADGSKYALGAATVGGRSKVYYTSADGLVEDSWIPSWAYACQSMGMGGAPVEAWVNSGSGGWHTG